MKIICKKQLLSENIAIAGRAVGTRSTLDILECILLVADVNGFRMIGNDLEIGIETTAIDATIQEEGTVALEARMFSEIVRKFPAEENVMITSDAKNLTVIKCGKAEFKILGMPGEEYPFPVKVEAESSFRLSAHSLKGMIRKTNFSVGTDESKPIMMGQLLKFDNTSVCLVSVDGFRMSVANSACDFDNGKQEAIIPGKTLSELAKIIQDEDEIVSISFSKRHGIFVMNSCSVVTRLIDGEFLNYENFFYGTEYTTVMTANAAAFAEALERASLISRESKKTPVRLKIEDDLLVVTSNTDLGESYDEFPIQIDGLAIEIGFNPRYLLDILHAVGDDEIVANFTTPLSPCVITGKESGDAMYLALPLRYR